MINYTPLPKVPSNVIDAIISSVDNILLAQQYNSEYDYASEQAAIDSIVYSLYQLTPSEVEIIESSFIKE